MTDREKFLKQARQYIGVTGNYVCNTRLHLGMVVDWCAYSISAIMDDCGFIGKYKEKRYGRLSLIVKNNGSAYILDDDEKIVFNIMDGNNIAISKNLTLIHYCGNGVYSYCLNMEDAGILHQLGNYTINIKVYRGDNDITSTLTIEYQDAEEWYDVHIIYDTGL